MPPRLPSLEKQIGSRLRSFRESLDLPLRGMAEELGVHHSSLASHERGRTALRWDFFKALAARYGLSARWLATGEGEHREPVPKRWMKAVLPAKSRFSAAFEKLSGEPLEKERKGSAGFRRLEVELIRIRKTVQFIRDQTEEHPELAQDPELRDSMLKVQQIAEATVLMLQGRKSAAQPIDSTAEPKGSDVLTAGGTQNELATKKGLPDVSKTDTNGPVNVTVPDWASLRQALLGMASQRGFASQLSRDLEVTRSRVSGWLRGESKPSADNTIRLLRWIQEQEEQQNKAPRR